MPSPLSYVLHTKLGYLTPDNNYSQDPHQAKRFNWTQVNREILRHKAKNIDAIYQKAPSTKK